ncbi:hypothetical protein BaRGS_00023660 [Batillaria attramentaria]|uniref:Splicing factor 45 n=1 Tax=Batillaria attramentaria TaxID=370345 RepID=A0ABD0KDU8_9CAEN
MSLYDGLDIDNKESTGSTKAVPGWSSGYKLLQSQLQAKKASLLQSTKKQRTSVLAPVVDLKRHGEDVPISFNMQTGKIERVAAPAPVLPAAPFIASEAIPSFTGVADEYNPLLPNEYEDLVKKKKEKKEEDRRRDLEERNAGRSSHRTTTITDGGHRSETNSVATKIMAKYGYREGQGLGKSEQGMSTALYVEKTSKRGGKIIHEKDIPKEMPKEPVSNTNLMKNPSKVILLTNMVGPGEVDEELEPETAEECTKYGKVIKVVIFEMPNVSDEEAVRIFVEFERMESAIKAIVDLNGRYFGGRVVRGGFYNLDKFRRLDLAGPLE